MSRMQPGEAVTTVTMRPINWRRLVTSPLRQLPDFVIIGAQKAGTTTLYNSLKRHPGIAPASHKELFFFDLQYHRGPMWYRAHFPYRPSRWPVMTRGRSQRLLSGESTPNYLFHPHAPGRMAAVIPQAKLLVLLRNPVDRAYSHYQHQVRAGRETLSFEDAVEQEPVRLHGELEKMQADARYDSAARHRYSYLARGVYVEQLQRWERAFSRQHMLIVNSEAFYADPASTLQRVTAWLGLSRWTPPPRKDNAGGAYAPMRPETRARLIGYFRPYNQRLYEHLGVSYGWDR